MEIFTLLGKMVLDGAEKVKSELQGIEGRLKESEKALKLVGTAFTVVGVAGLKMVSDARQLNSQLGQTAITLGVSTKEMRNLALSTTNVTFPLQSVTATFDLLARAGVRNVDQLKASANAFDALADATGSSAEVVADILIPAYKSLGEEIPQTSEEMDKFTWLTKNTTINLEDFGSVMQYVAMYGADLNVTIDDMIGIMAALEARGISGSAATRLFRTAVTQAKDGAVSLNEALGVTQEEIDGYKTQIEGATGLTDQYAKVANEQYGIMDKLKQTFSEITLRIGSLLTPLEPLLGMMTTLGPVMMFLSTSMGRATITTIGHTTSLVAHKVATIAVTVATKAAAAAQWLFNSALLANPITLVIVALGGLAAAGFALARNWDKVSRDIGVVWDRMESNFGKAMEGMTKVATDFFTLKWGNIIREFSNSANNLVESVNKIGTGFINVAQSAMSSLGLIDKSTKQTTEIVKTSAEEQAEALEIAEKALKKATNEYDIAVKTQAGYKDKLQAANKQLKDQQGELKNAQDALKLINEAVRDAADEVAKWERAMSDAKSELRDLMSPQLVGMGEMDDALFGIGMQIKQLELERLTNPEIAASLDEQIDALREQQRILELQRDITFDPLIREIEKAGEAALGLNKEMFPQDVLDRISELAASMGPGGKLTIGYETAAANLDEQNRRLADQQSLIEDLETEVIRWQDTIINLDATIKDTLDKKQEAVNFRTDVVTAIQGVVTDTSPFLDSLQKQIKNILSAASDIPGVLTTIQTSLGKVVQTTEAAKKSIAAMPTVTPEMVGLPSWWEYMTFPVPAYQHGGPITEPTVLYGVRSQRPYATAEQGERVTPEGAYRTVNITLELDGKTLARVIGQPLVDEIRIRQGLRI